MYSAASKYESVLLVKPHSQSSFCSPPLWQGQVSELENCFDHSFIEQRPLTKHVGRKIGKKKTALPLLLPQTKMQSRANSKVF